MHHWTRRLFAIAAPLLLTGCLWGPGKFVSELTLRKDGSFTLDYRGEIVLQVPEDAAGKPWNAEMAHCLEGAKTPGGATPIVPPGSPRPKARACSAAEIAAQKAEYEKRAADKRKDAEQMAKAFGLPGLDDASNRAFAAKIMKYAGWRSVTYRGNGVFDVDYHLQGSARQDFVFPALPDNEVILPFVAMRQRTDGSVLVTAPALTGGPGSFMARMAAAGAQGDAKTNMVSHAQGRFTILTDGEILTNNSEDGPAASSIGRQLHWDVGPSSTKVPETLIRL